jgi:dynein heavy chain 1
LANPPAKVKLALEPVIALITHAKKAPAWPEIKKALNDKNFKNNVLNFKKEDIKPATKEFITNTYLKEEGAYEIDAFMKASKAAGPLAKWLKSIIEFAEIYLNIAPMREELA